MIGRFSRLGVYEELLQSSAFIKLGIGALLALAGFVLEQWLEPGARKQLVSSGLYLASVAVNGLPIVVGAVQGLLERRVNVDELLALAIVASLAGGELLTAAVVSTIMVLGSLIEEATAESARRSIQALIQVSPKQALRIEAGQEQLIDVDQVRLGDHLLVKPGEQIPVDGVVLEGSSSADESAITGEAMPVAKQGGDQVLAGTLNHNGVLHLRAEKVGSDTTLGRVIALVEEAENQKPRSIAFIDRFARVFTPLILGCALVAWLLTGDFSRAVAVLIVGCPCALILAVPTATVAAIGRAARAGILVKGGQYIEGAALANTLFFDKTGTLTEGNPRVERIFTVESTSEREILGQAASVECLATHPLARAVVQAAHYARVSIEAARDLCTEIGLGVRGTLHGQLIEVGSVYLHGGMAAVPEALRPQLEGIKQRGATPLMVYRNAQALGFLSVSDRIRMGAGQAIGRLRQLGFGEIGILSGDHPQSVAMVTSEVGATRGWPSLKPQDKLDVIRERQQQGARVIFVGDGINDAPALAAADVGIAMGARGSEVALETADIALMGDDLNKLPFLVALGRRMLLVIKVNIAFGLLFNLLAVVAGASGLITPIMGAVVHNIGSVLVVLSSASLALFAQRP